MDHTRPVGTHSNQVLCVQSTDDENSCFDLLLQLWLVKVDIISLAYTYKKFGTSTISKLLGMWTYYCGCNKFLFGVLVLWPMSCQRFQLQRSIWTLSVPLYTAHQLVFHYPPPLKIVGPLIHSMINNVNNVFEKLLTYKRVWHLSRPPHVMAFCLTCHFPLEEVSPFTMGYGASWLSSPVSVIDKWRFLMDSTGKILRWKR